MRKRILIIMKLYVLLCMFSFRNQFSEEENMPYVVENTFPDFLRIISQNTLLECILYCQVAILFILFGENYLETIHS